MDPKSKQRRPNAGGDESVSQVRYRSSDATHLLERARAAWPAFKVDTEQFVDRILVPLDPQKPSEVALKQLAVEDLFLAFACAKGDPLALDSFAREYDPDFDAVALKLRIAKSDADDARQALWVKLFMPSATGGMKILEYRGAGRLRHWFRAAAARTLLDVLRRAKRQPPMRDSLAPGALDVAASNTDPELFGLRQRYLDEFRTAFNLALAALEPDERNCLRYHYLMGMTSDQMAVVLATHRATAARRVARARDKLLEATRDHLKRHLRTTSGELDSIMRLFDGELSISLSRLFE